MIHEKFSGITRRIVERGGPDPDSREAQYRNPFHLIIIEDCRRPETYGPAGSLTGQYGWCLGLFDQETWDPSLEGDPLIHSDSNDYIWGTRCWWKETPLGEEEIPLNDLQNALQIHKQNIIAREGMDMDPSLN